MAEKKNGNNLLKKESLYPSIKAKQKVTIGISCFSNHESTRLTLEALYKNTSKEMFHLLIMNDNPPDNEMDLILESFCLLHNNISILGNKTNIGVVRANNRFVSFTNTKYLILMNSDVLVTSNWLNSFLKCANDFPHWNIIGSRLLYPNDTIQHAGIGYHPNPYKSSEFEDIWAYLPYHPRRGMNKNDKSCLCYREMAGVTTALAIFNMDMFNKIGSFDDTYSPGIYDDPDFCLTAISRGYTIGYCPRVVAFHLEGRSFDKDKSKKMSILERNAKYFLSKWEPWLSKFIRPKFKYSEWGSYIKYGSIK